MTKSAQKMIVLRDNSVVRTRSRKGTNFDFNEGPRPSVSNFEAATNGNRSTAEPVLLVENYDKKNFSEASRDPSVVAVAESMSLSLVKPLANRQLRKTELQDAPLDQLKADGVTWGIKEVGADFCLPALSYRAVYWAAIAPGSNVRSAHSRPALPISARRGSSRSSVSTAPATASTD